MNNYFELLPEELVLTIAYFLDYNDLLEVRENVQINIEKLFVLRYPEDYKNIKLLFKYDKDMNVYRYMWELFYSEYIKGILKVESITSNVRYSSLLLKNYPKFYKYKKIFSDILEDPYVSYHSLSYEILGTLNYVNEEISGEIDTLDSETLSLRKFFKGENITNEEFSKMEFLFDNPEILMLMMLEGDFLPKDTKTKMLKMVENCINENKSDGIYNIYNIMVEVLYRHYKFQFEN